MPTLSVKYLELMSPFYCLLTVMASVVAGIILFSVFITILVCLVMRKRKVINGSINDDVIYDDIIVTTGKKKTVELTGNSACTRYESHK